MAFGDVITILGEAAKVDWPEGATVTVGTLDSVDNEGSHHLLLAATGMTAAATIKAGRIVTLAKRNLALQDDLVLSEDASYPLYQKIIGVRRGRKAAHFVLTELADSAETVTDNRRISEEANALSGNTLTVATIAGTPVPNFAGFGAFGDLATVSGSDRGWQFSFSGTPLVAKLFAKGKATIGPVSGYSALARFDTPLPLDIGHGESVDLLDDQAQGIELWTDFLGDTTAENLVQSGSATSVEIQQRGIWQIRRRDLPSVAIGAILRTDTGLDYRIENVDKLTRRKHAEITAVRTVAT